MCRRYSTSLGARAAPASSQPASPRKADRNAKDRITSSDGADAPDGFDDDARNACGCLIRQEEHVPRDGHHICVRARLERSALVLGQPSVALFRMNDPGWNAGPAEPLGPTFVPIQPPYVLAQPAHRVLRHVLAEVFLQLAPAFGRERGA